MKRTSIRRWVIWVILIIAIFVADYLNYRGRIKRLEKSLSKEVYPLPDPSKGKALFYSIQSKQWVYSTIPGAIAPGIANEPNEDHETFLKRHVPIYKKKTYWGEEWDEYTGQEEDIIWDENGDDNEIEK